MGDAALAGTGSVIFLSDGRAFSEEAVFGVDGDAADATALRLARQDQLGLLDGASGQSAHIERQDGSEGIAVIHALVTELERTARRTIGGQLSSIAIISGNGEDSNGTVACVTAQVATEIDGEVGATAQIKQARIANAGIAEPCIRGTGSPIG